jgi:hypothetical protein
MRPGDVVSVLGGAEMPFVIRRNGETFQLIGECYVDDIMDGQACDAANAGKAHQGPFDAACFMEKIFTFEDVLDITDTAMEILYDVKKDILRAAQKEYTQIRVEHIKLR